MSFRGDDQRRYGQVPPVQYAVSGQQERYDPYDQPDDGLGRRSSFNTGDDAGYNDQAYHRPPSFDNSSRRADELFLTNSGPSAASVSRYASTSGAMSGYQHQYQYQYQEPAQATYNPQSFAPSSTAFQRSQSTTLPYHPHPSAAQPSSNYGAYNTPSPPTNYTPQAYNPAAYATTNAVPQRHSTYHGYATQDAVQSASTASPGGGSSYGGSSPSATYNSTYSQPTRATSVSTTHHQSFPTSPSAGQQAGAGYNPSQYGSNVPYQGYTANGAPYPANSDIPVGPNYAGDHSSYYGRQRSDSQTSPRGSPYMHSQSPGAQRHPGNAPLPSRPMDDLPEETPWDEHGRPLRHHDSYDEEEDDDYDEHTQESIMQDIEAELGGAGYREGQPNGDGHAGGHHGLDSGGTSSVRRQTYEDSDDDDPEGTAGVLAMQQAELDDQRFGGSSFMYSAPVAPPQPSSLHPPPVDHGQTSDSDAGYPEDLGMVSGGHSGQGGHGADLTSPPGSSDAPRPLPTPGYYDSLRRSYDLGAAYDSAEVDYGGTGGLQPPRPERLSFDEGGDERVSIHSRTSGTESPVKDEYQELFYHPGLSSRPLPALPGPGGPGSDSSSMLSPQNSLRTQQQHAHTLSADVRYYQGDGPEAYYQQGQQGLQPERSISLSSYSHTPPVQAPARSRTDANDDRKKAARGAQGPPGSDYDSTTAVAGDAFGSITLPSGRKKKFVPAKLTAAEFNHCTEPWALSGIESWLRAMADGEMDLREKTVEEGLTNLFVYKIPTMNVADAEALGSQVVAQMLASETLLPEEEWVKFGEGHVSGVLWQLTGAGCYAPKLHDIEISGRCYAYHCTRTLKKVDLEMLQDEAPGGDAWNVFYSLKKEDWESKPRKEVDRQNILHEIVTGEENYIKQLDIFRTLYRDDLRTRNPPILTPDKRDKFLAAVFGKLDTVLRINKDHLLAQLKYRQQEQGPWIVGFSDIFREWIRKAKSDYIEYATGYPRATYMVRREAARNLLLKKFLEDKQRHKSSSKQDWTHFLIAPVTRLQRYPLLLESVASKMISDSEEKTNLLKAIQEIKVVTKECDDKVAETNRRVEMMELDRMLVLRPGFQSVLNLDHLGRVLIKQGELQRMGSKGMRWVESHALLFDHYLILAKEVVPKDGRGEKKYDVSREPIPMPLLFLESNNDEPVMKQKGITAPLGRTTAAPVGSQLSKVTSNGGGRPGLETVGTGSSATSLTPGSVASETEGKILYPFKVKHLGHEVYTLYASSANDREDWCTKIADAKTRHAQALFAQNAEPFRLRVLADASFHYDGASPYARAAGVPVKGTPLDRAIGDIEGLLGSAQAVAPVCRAQVNCATAFMAFGKPILAIGTDYGVFISDPSSPRGWTRSVQAVRVTQMAVLEEFSVCLAIADKSLICYPLDVVAPVSEFAAPNHDSPRRAPQRLAKDVTYFATARMKDRTLVFYKRKEGLHTSFKVLEPIFHKATEKKSRLFGGRKSATGSTDTFRDFDEFYLPTECYSLSIFQTYIAVATSKGIEMLTLDKKQPMSIPDLKAPAIANIASRVRDQRPLGMFRLNENEFLLTYEDCAVYVDKHGDVSRTLIMEYTGKQKKARGAAIYGKYLMLFNDDYVEVRNAENGRLRQIIAGRDVRVIDFGIRGPTGGNAAQSQQLSGPNGGADLGGMSKGTVKVAMCHPELAGRQIVLEMLLNDGHAEG